MVIEILHGNGEFRFVVRQLQYQRPQTCRTIGRNTIPETEIEICNAVRGLTIMLDVLDDLGT